MCLVRVCWWGVESTSTLISCHHEQERGAPMDLPGVRQGCVCAQAVVCAHVVCVLLPAVPCVQCVQCVPAAACMAAAVLLPPHSNH